MFIRKVIIAGGARAASANGNSSHFLRQASRSFGISDKIMDFAHSKVNDRKEETFRKTMDEMIKAKKWTLKSWRVTLDESLNSWLLKIPGMKDSSEVTAIKQYKDILDVMTPEELENHDVIKGRIVSVDLIGLDWIFYLILLSVYFIFFPSFYSTMRFTFSFSL